MFRLFTQCCRDNVRGQIRRQNHIVLAQSTGALDGILQFPDVPWIIIMAKDIDGLGIDLLRLAARSSRLFLQEMMHEQRHVFETLA